MMDSMKYRDRTRPSNKHAGTASVEARVMRETTSKSEDLSWSQPGSEAPRHTTQQTRYAWAIDKGPPEDVRVCSPPCDNCKRRGDVCKAFRDRSKGESCSRCRLSRSRCSLVVSSSKVVSRCVADFFLATDSCCKYSSCNSASIQYTSGCSYLRTRRPGDAGRAPVEPGPTQCRRNCELNIYKPC